MPDLSNTVRWVEYVPDLLGNADAERPFYFLLHGSMSKEQMSALQAATSRQVGPADLEPLPDDATDEQRAAREAELEQHGLAIMAALAVRDSAALEPYVRFGEEPLSLDGTRLTTLKEYFELVTSPRLLGLGAYHEVHRALVAANTMEPRISFSSGRLSGGGTSTARTKAAGRRVAR